jgi:cytochrome b pre-mRNA-processing protein 3
MILRLFRKKNRHAGAADALYAAAVRQARRPTFYVEGGVPDTVEGRFDLIALHVYMVLRRLKEEGGAAADLAQALFDRMFEDMEQNLREMGVSDLRVGARVKDMAKAFYGRIAAYDKGLEEGDAILTDALDRNLFRNVRVAPERLDEAARYLRAGIAALETQSLADILAAGPRFPSEDET